MAQLWDFYEFFQDLILDRSMYYVAKNLLLPLTQPARLSYAELAGPQEVQWFVSHFWGMAFKDSIASLRKHAAHEGRGVFLGWRAVTFWVCTFSNNQWDVETELGSGDPLDSSFYHALRSQGCRGTTMVLDQEALPLTRSWCLFEVLQTCVLKRQRGEAFTGLLLCTPTGVLQHGGTGVDAAVSVAQQLSTLSLEDARASRAEDKIMIDGCVRRMPGGFGEMNRFVRDCIKEALYTARESFEADFVSLLTALDTMPEDELLAVMRGRTGTLPFGSPPGSAASPGLQGSPAGPLGSPPRLLGRQPAAEIWGKPRASVPLPRSDRDEVDLVDLQV